VGSPVEDDHCRSEYLTAFLLLQPLNTPGATLITGSSQALDVTLDAAVELRQIGQ